MSSLESACADLLRCTPELCRGEPVTSGEKARWSRLGDKDSDANGGRWPCDIDGGEGCIGGMVVMGGCVGDSAWALGRPKSRPRTQGRPPPRHQRVGLPVSRPFPLATHPAPAPHLQHICAPRSNVVEFPPPLVPQPACLFLNPTRWHASPVGGVRVIWPRKNLQLGPPPVRAHIWKPLTRVRPALNAPSPRGRADSGQRFPPGTPFSTPPPLLLGDHDPSTFRAATGGFRDYSDLPHAPR